MCLENGRFDNDCCAVKGSAKCKGNHTLEWANNGTKVCFDGGSWKAYNYFCRPPVLANETIKVANETAKIGNETVK